MEYYDGQDLEKISEEEWRNLALPQLQRKQKPISKLWGLSQTIFDIDPDILMLVEVGGQESLERFNRFFLGEKFTPYFIEGNSKRSIDLGFLVKKGLPYRVETYSNKDLPIEVYSYQGKYTAQFSRDVAELRLYENDQLQLILLLTHLKSMISTETDFKGKDVRTAEAVALAGLYQNHRENYPDTPIVLAGDFNAHIKSLDLELLQRTDLTDFHDILGSSNEERVSLFHFDYSGSRHSQILDYILISPQLKDKIVPEKSHAYRYKSYYDIPAQLPTTLEERRQLPSDHYPLVVTLNLE
jgi:endonuclease/exonuclease/phosphatase family metal-dependent hydrolase